MSKATDWVARAFAHPGASLSDILDEPDWTGGHTHRVGFKDRSNRRPGFTTIGPDDEHADDVIVKEATRKFELLRGKSRDHELVNFRDIVNSLQDFHLVHPERYSVGWRFVLDCTEDWVKYGQAWPANLKRLEKEKEKEKQKKDKGDEEKKGQEKKDEKAEPKKDEEGKEAPKEEEGEEEEELDDEQAKMLNRLRKDQEYIASLKENDGQGPSPESKPRDDITIDQIDQFTPDNWFPRSKDLLRVTGAHPLNAEPPLESLVNESLITPNPLHYVRNHGAVPRLLWDLHEIRISHGEDGGCVSMDDLKRRWDTVNIPVLLACDGNRRKELSMIRTTKGVGFGAGAAGCAYWKGPLLREVLLDHGVPDPEEDASARHLWVNFEGADELPNGRYATCIPLAAAMDPTNDIILAYQMNDVPLPPDHGYPVRVVIPGFVGGRSVKWLRRIWTSEEENQSYYHIFDNRLLPSYITDDKGPLARTLFRHHESIIYEQVINSAVTRPSHGERIRLSEGKKEKYTVRGFAYSGAGRKIQSVEISLDGGKSWMYCSRRLPNAPIRHGNKFWTWLHWEAEVSVASLLEHKSITVRCFDASKNTQPEGYNWNVLGMMNNARYTVRGEIITAQDDGAALDLLFRHPVTPGVSHSTVEGWMKPSVENQIEAAKLSGGTDGGQKQFTREEIEKHDKEDDCWIIVDGHVYDATPVLSWHPGGKAPIMAHAGRVHQKTTDEFNSVHDAYARERLQESHLGVISQKVAKFMREEAQKAAELERKDLQDDTVALHIDRWTRAKLVGREHVSEDTSRYTFELPEGKKLGLGNGQHIELGFHLKDKMLIRQYTPTRPVLPPRKDGNPHEPGSRQNVHDGDGTFDLIVKTYLPSDEQPGGAMSNILDTIPIGGEVDMKGPSGEIIYHGKGRFTIEGRDRHFRRVSFLLGGSGITPGYSIIARILLDDDDPTEIRVVDGNKAEGDILLRGELSEFEEKSKGQMKVTHVLSEPAEDWKGLKGFVTDEILREHIFPPTEDSVAFMCGPPAMIKFAALPGLKNLGYEEDKNMFGF